MSTPRGALRAGLGDWFQRYNAWRPLAALGNLTPCAYYDRSVAATLTEASEALSAA